MAPFLELLIKGQPQRAVTYAEPYAGGAGAALHLLTSGVVKDIALNDLNSGVAAFWRVLFTDSKRLIGAMRTVDVSLREWHRQREIYLDEDADDFERAFSTFFLNRTNRSGILGARPIGGLGQDGPWKIDARFNVEDLAARMEYLSQFSDRVSVTQLDGRLFLSENDSPDVFFYVDPPYLKQGEDLYLANMTYKDHLALARTLHGLGAPWVLTYDHDDRVPEHLYPDLSCAEFTVSHTAAKQHVGSEYLVVPSHVRVDRLDGFGPRQGIWLKHAVRFRRPSRLA